MHPVGADTFPPAPVGALPKPQLEGLFKAIVDESEKVQTEVSAEA